MTRPAGGWKDQPYNGFEQGPIRPPSEAESLLIRVTRNCPWNHCSFCPVYKHQTFSLRPVAHVLRDIDTVAGYVYRLKDAAGTRGRLDRDTIHALGRDAPAEDEAAFHAALHWASGGMKSIFLQDANSLILPASDVIAILEHLRARFPWVERITSYARSHTVSRIAADDLAAMRTAGLNRIHIGMESGCDEVLKQIRKGCTQAQHIRAGLNVKAAGMALSEYVIPGLGGRELSACHALDTAAALNRIDSDFIRLRTLALPHRAPLYEQWRDGRFKKLTDTEMVREILAFIEALDGIHSRIVSDHMLNLFEEIDGRLPDDKPRLADVLRNYLDRPRSEQMLFQVGRRIGAMRFLADLGDSRKVDRVRAVCRQHGITTENVDAVVDDLMKRFV